MVLESSWLSSFRSDPGDKASLFVQYRIGELACGFNKDKISLLVSSEGVSR